MVSSIEEQLKTLTDKEKADMKHLLRRLTVYENLLDRSQLKIVKFLYFTDVIFCNKLLPVFIDDLPMADAYIEDYESYDTKMTTYGLVAAGSSYLSSLLLYRYVLKKPSLLKPLAICIPFTMYIYTRTYNSYVDTLYEYYSIDSAISTPFIRRTSLTSSTISNII